MFSDAAIAKSVANGERVRKALKGYESQYDRLIGLDDFEYPLNLSWLAPYKVGIYGRPAQESLVLSPYDLMRNLAHFKNFNERTVVTWDEGSELVSTQGPPLRVEPRKAQFNIEAEVYDGNYGIWEINLSGTGRPHRLMDALKDYCRMPVKPRDHVRCILSYSEDNLADILTKGLL